jgi:YVTN family beta-propeller protein
VASLTAGASPAHAADDLPTTQGTGTGTLTITPETTKSGAVITVSGTDFVERPEGGYLVFKLNDGKNPAVLLPADGQPDGEGASSGDVTVTSPDLLPDATGSFSVDLKLPEFPEDGTYWIRVLGGNDGGAAVSKWAAFTVADNAAAPEEQQLTVGTVATASTGVVTVAVSGSGYTPGATLTASVAGAASTWTSGRGTADSITVGDDGTFSGTVNVPVGAAPAGENTLTLTSSEDGDADVDFTSTPGLSFTGGSAANSTSEVVALNLPTGAVVTGLGTQGANWLADSYSVTDGTSVTIPDVTIPKGTASAAPIVLTYSLGGSSVSFTSSVLVTPDNSPINEESFLDDSAELPQGLYQTAYNPDTKTLFATSSVGRPPLLEASLLKIDPESLEVIKSVTPAQVSDDFETDGVYGPYGIGLDNAKGYVWVTTTRQNTVAVYDQETLELVKQFPADQTAHARDVVVDETTHLAYVSSSTDDFVDVYSGAGEEPAYVGRITLSSDSQEFSVVMSLDIDQETGIVYTVSLNSQVAAAIDTRNGNAVTYYQLGDHVGSASGVAYDPVAHNLYIASQTTNNAVVVNTVSGRIIADIPTGAQALNAAYDPENGLVYVANRTGGTVTVINASTLEVVGNVPAGTNTNHVEVGDGVAFAVDKGDPNQIFRITPTDASLTAQSTLPASGEDLDAALDLGADALSDASPAPGDEITLTVGAQYAGQLVNVHLFSDPENITPEGVVVSEDGTVTATIPADTETGAHQVAVANQYGLVLGWAALDVQVEDEDTDDGNTPGTDDGNTPGTDDGTDDGNTPDQGTDVTTSDHGQKDLAETGFDPSLIALASLLVLGGGALTIAPRLRSKH